MTVRSAQFLAQRTAALQVRFQGRAQAFIEAYSRQLRKVPKNLARPAEKILLEETHKSIDRELNKNPTGKLKKSYRTEVIDRGDTVSVKVASDLPYARIHDVGGVIRPKSAQALTVPIHPMARGRRARDLPGLFRPTGTNVLAVKAGPDFVPVFALVQQVRIPATQYLEKARRHARERLNTAIKASLELAAQLAKRSAT